MVRRKIPAKKAAAPERVQQRKQILRRRWKIHRAWVYYGIAVAVYALLFGVWQVQPVPLEVHAVGMLIAAICMFPMTFWYVQGSKGVPVFEVICIAYLLQFANPVYLQPNSYLVFSQAVSFSWDEIMQTLLLVGLGVGCMIVGYYATRRSPLRNRVPRIDLPLDPQRRPRYFIAALGFGGGMLVLQETHLMPSFNAAGAIVNLITMQFTIAIILLAYRVYRRETVGVRWSLLLYGSVAVSVGLGLATGFLEPVLIPLVLLFFVHWHVTRRFPLHWVAIGFVAFVLLQSVKTEYRQAAWSSGSSLPAKAALWLELPAHVVQNTFTGDVAMNSQNLVRQAFARFDYLHTFAWVHRETPSVVPYYNGSSYEYFLYGWIPRAVWPDKPIAQVGQIRYELDYQLLGANQINGASIGIGHIGEAYANFGTLGVAIVLAIQGMILALFADAFNGPEADGARAIYLAIMVTFLNGIGSATTTIFGGILQNAFASAVILRLFSTGWRPTAPDQSTSRRRRPSPLLRRPAPGATKAHL